MPTKLTVEVVHRTGARPSERRTRELHRSVPARPPRRQLGNRLREALHPVRCGVHGKTPRIVSTNEDHATVWCCCEDLAWLACERTRELLHDLARGR